ncbi:MAG: hypothetical protein HFJ37_05145 [Clostridia bacterium]|nr:hypothetical protein [Clostridia bacterium]
MKRILKKLVLILILFSIAVTIFFNTSFAAGTIDDIMGGAEDFITEGHKRARLNEEELHQTSNFLYNLLLGVGFIVAVIVGVILGIKYMVGSVEDKAELKETLLAYAVGCIVVFGAFGIWKIAVNILSAVE